ncbi:hypothetical protein GUJ93_ZPchr0010g8822 [Zizania palustris]|uniref:Uncharacterized protein n=1 Tax=Zizania palustris TaxID=103762 RepID=A0A8J6BRQ5_ZIZPA|nr:hypothetical protein GUJ93_ZPchr0010g8822 [Zizania palustris]
MQLLDLDYDPPAGSNGAHSYLAASPAHLQPAFTLPQAGKAVLDATARLIRIAASVEMRHKSGEILERGRQRPSGRSSGRRCREKATIVAAGWRRRPSGRHGGRKQWPLGRSGDRQCRVRQLSAGSQMHAAAGGRRPRPSG